MVKTKKIENVQLGQKKISLVSGVTVNIQFPKKALPSTYLLASKYSPVFFFPRIKRFLGVFIYQ